MRRAAISSTGPPAASSNGCERAKRRRSAPASSGIRKAPANRSRWYSSARMLRASQDLEDYKIVMVNDRAGSGGAAFGDGEANRWQGQRDREPGRRCAQQLASTASDVNMVMVHKFMERERGAAGKSRREGSARLCGRRPAPRTSAW